MKWEVLTRREVVRDQWLRLTEDTCRRDDGSTIESYYVIHGRDWVNVTPITTDGDVVLVREYRHGFGQVLLGLPGGLIDADDISCDTAALRELREELGLAEVLHLEQTATMIVNPSTHTNVAHSYVAVIAADEKAALRTSEPDITIEVRDLFDVVAEVLNGARLYSGYDAASLLRAVFFTARRDIAPLRRVRDRARAFLAAHFSRQENE
jgi:ADP-ribose pyrophosphatase